MITTEQYNSLLKEYIETNKINNATKGYLYNEKLIEMSKEKGCTLIDFSVMDLVELIYDRIMARSVATFHSVRGSYSKFFDWLILKGVVSRNPCLQAPLSLEKFTEFLSYEDDMRPYERDYICQAINLNGINVDYYNIIMLSIYEGICSSYRQLVDLRFSDVDFENGIIHTNFGDRVPSDRLLKSISKIRGITDFEYTYKTGTLITVNDRIVPYILVKKSDIEELLDDKDANHRIQKSMYKLIARFNDRNNTNFSQQKLWESGLINRVVSALGKEVFVDIMLNPIKDKSEHDRLNKILFSTYGWDFQNELAIDKFKTAYRYHAVRIKRELEQGVPE